MVGAPFATHPTAACGHVADGPVVSSISLLAGSSGYSVGKGDFEGRQAQEGAELGRGEAGAVSPWEQHESLCLGSRTSAGLRGEGAVG